MLASSSPRAEQKFCQVLVTVTFQCCYHNIQVKCGNRDEYLSGKTICDKCCGKPLICKHLCQGICGECVKDNVHSGEDATNVLDAAKQRTGTSVFGKLKLCSAKCQKTLVNMCSHPCNQPCHDFYKTVCGVQSCSQECTLNCVHSKCRKQCGEPCNPCAEECSWQCEHEGKCQLVCSAPCIRFPCNLRCSKFLPCSHRCPGVCGEDCNYFKPFCVECGLSQDILSMEVDLINFETLAQVDCTLDPLIALPCGKHVLTMSSADGLFGIDDVYTREPITGKFNGTKTIVVASDSFGNKKVCCIHSRVT